MIGPWASFTIDDVSVSFDDMGYCVEFLGCSLNVNKLRAIALRVDRGYDMRHGSPSDWVAAVEKLSGPVTNEECKSLTDK